MSPRIALNKDDEIIGYEFVNLGKMMDAIKKGMDANEAMEKAKGTLRPVRRRRQRTSTPVRNKKGGHRPMALFESYERRIDKINAVLAQYGIDSVEECRDICKANGLRPATTSSRAFSPSALKTPAGPTAVGAAIALKKGVKTAAEAAEAIGVGLQAFCIPGSVAEDRKVGLGHGNLGAMLLRDETKCFAFLAGHESFAAAEGAIGIVRNANKARKEPLRVILNGLGKDAAQIISRINGFTYVQTQFDYYTGELKIVREIRLFRGRAGQRPLLRRRRRARGRGHHAPRGRGRVHHRQLHQPHPLPAPRGRHL